MGRGGADLRIDGNEVQRMGGPCKSVIVKVQKATGQPFPEVQWAVLQLPNQPQNQIYSLLSPASSQGLGPKRKEDVTKYFGDFPRAGERSFEFQGCSQTHSGSKTLQIPEEAFPFPADGL